MTKTLRKSDGTFIPGHPGLGGRPPGSRNRLTEVALAALSEHFAEHGKAAIDRVCSEKPHVYLQVVASLLPRQVTVEKLSPFSDISDSELELMEETLAAARAKIVRELERHQNGKALESKDER